MTRRRELDCNELVEVVTDYLEGTLDDESRRRFVEHLKRCNGCETYVAQIRETVRLVGTLREEHLCPDVRDKLLEAFRGWKARPVGERDGQRHRESAPPPLTQKD